MIKALVASIVGNSLAAVHVNFMQMNNGLSVMQLIERKIALLTATPPVLQPVLQPAAQPLPAVVGPHNFYPAPGRALDAPSKPPAKRSALGSN